MQVVTQKIQTLGNAENPFWQASALERQQQQNPYCSSASVRPWQAAALAAFLTQGIPDRHQEAWKYTHLRALSQATFTWAAKPSVLDSLRFIADAYRIVFVDGYFQAELSQVPADIKIANSLALLTDKTQQMLLGLDAFYDTPFSCLNGALLTDGVWIVVPKECRLAQPLHMIYVHSGKTSNAMTYPRHVVVAESGSQFTWVEEYVGAAEPYFNNVVTHLMVKAGAQVSHYKIQNEGRQAQHIANTLITQDRDSVVISHLVSLGGALGRENLSVNLREENASVHLYGLYLPRQQQQIDHHTRIDHRVPRCFSVQDYRGIIAAEGQGIFNGKIYVHPDAQQTVACQSNKNLLLGDKAEVDAKPELEIYADDVKCSHGSTVGCLDEVALFYLRSRGISEGLARSLLTQAFADFFVTEKMPANLALHLREKIKIALEEVA